jgi:SAM-dependent methyltransferase
MDATGPNAEQITFWNTQAGQKWVARQERMDVMIAPYGRAAMDALQLAVGDRVTDVGCGCGDTTLELARRVAPGRALGVDISEPMLTRARERARAAGTGNVAFALADAQTHAFDAHATDVVFSRFGVMFFAEPTAAFANLHAALVPHGRLGFVCWQAMVDNPWVTVPLGAALQHVPPPPPPVPGAPGPFAFADRDRVARILGEAGFHDVACDPFTPTVTVGGGGGLDEAAEFLSQMGPASQVLRDASPATITTVRYAVRQALAPYLTPRGVEMPSAAWLVTARA